MAHVTFIHGIANKPNPDALLRIWRRALADCDGFDLGDEGVSSSMVYWADVMYEKPDDEQAGYESTEAVAERTSEQEDDLTWIEGLDDEERQLVEQLSAAYGLDIEPPQGDENYEPPLEQIDVGLEAVPLPWWFKKRMMRWLLRDVHHYLFNAVSEPRAGESYRVQDELRSRFLAALETGRTKPGPHAVVSHSMGTVIAYDCLRRVADCPKVDSLMTLGSPLGLDEIQDKLSPEWTREDGFPSAKVAANWTNIYDRFDPVCGFDPVLANDYQRSGVKAINDINEQNWGRWRHSITKYLAQPKLRARLRQLLGR